MKIDNFETEYNLNDRVLVQLFDRYGVVNTISGTIENVLINNKKRITFGIRLDNGTYVETGKSKKYGEYHILKKIEPKPQNTNNNEKKIEKDERNDETLTICLCAIVTPFGVIGFGYIE